MFLFKLSIPDAIRSLQQVSSFGLGPQPTQQQMLKAIEKVETQHPSNSAELEYSLGIAWRNYTAWFIRSDERKPYLEKAVMHFAKAYTLEKGSSGAKWTSYASELGALLVEEALIRDLERGIPLLEAVFQSTRDYEPLLALTPKLSTSLAIFRKQRQWRSNFIDARRNPKNGKTAFRPRQCGLLQWRIALTSSS